jgi:DNA-binding FadR family transcriptional regulator
MTTFTLNPINRSLSLVEEVGQQLSHFIRNNLDSEDMNLPSERALAEMLGVSRPVVREAVKRLEQQGLVETRHGIGTTVVDKLHKPLIGSLSLLIPDETERLRQLNETRLAIEPMAACLAAKRASRQQVESLWSIHADLQSASNLSEAIDIDLVFHRTLTEASGNLIYRLILDSLGEIGLASRQLTIGRVGKQKAIDHHARILAAVAEGDADEAEVAMRDHILIAIEDMQERSS